MAVQTGFHVEAPRAHVSAAGWFLAGVAVTAIWVAVLVSSLWAPDFVSGSQQEHLPIVGWLDWIWGCVATGFVALAALRGVRSHTASLTPWIILAAGTTLVWLGVAVASIYAPTFVTGSDPTQIPLTAMGVPILGTFLTWFVCTFAKTAFAEE